MNDTVLNPDRRVELAAKIAHNVNQAYCKAIGENTMGSWEDCPHWQKVSCYTGVIYHMENRDITPEQSHKSWLKHKRENGWVYGEVKDEVKKTHPCMVPYEELPIEQKIKDYIFKAVVDSILE